ncbi:MAG: hypothetical protein A2Y25_02630 [Candidatus Melainabacteria bacterium GWF2_37_15]|nr:MAG: hypothetical protein A2Y25_02630 [Candidatus Melainabacteria bacterium GWF2_37_15]
MCKHKNITPFSAGNFCPDCGKKIEISWLILRCSCCQSKRQAGVVFNSVVPRSKYCIKCGTSECYTEKKEQIEFYDFEYAVISKKEADNNLCNKEILQIWVEQERNSNYQFNNLKLLPKF